MIGTSHSSFVLLATVTKIDSIIAFGKGVVGLSVSSLCFCPSVHALAFIITFLFLVRKMSDDTAFLCSSSVNFIISTGSKCATHAIPGGLFELLLLLGFQFLLLLTIYVVFICHICLMCIMVSNLLYISFNMNVLGITYTWPMFPVDLLSRTSEQTLHNFSFVHLHYCGKK